MASPGASPNGSQAPMRSGEPCVVPSPSVDKISELSGRTRLWNVAGDPTCLTRSPVEATMDGIGNHPSTPATPRRRIQALESLGFVWDPYRETWRSTYESIIKEDKPQGDSGVVPERNEDYPGHDPGRGGLWAPSQRVQRQKFKEGKPWLTRERIEALESLGFVWDRYSEVWRWSYEERQEQANRPYGGGGVGYNLPPRRTGMLRPEPPGRTGIAAAAASQQHTEPEEREKQGGRAGTFGSFGYPWES